MTDHVDPRIEAAAKAIHARRFPEASSRFGWNLTHPEQQAEALDYARAALAAADKAATITEPEQLAALPANTRLESQVGPNFDYWNVHGDLLATCLSAVGYLGPITEIKLPARVIHWGTE